MVARQPHNATCTPAAADNVSNQRTSIHTVLWWYNKFAGDTAYNTRVEASMTQHHHRQRSDTPLILLCT
jgi:hypothetical protein